MIYFIQAGDSGPIKIGRAGSIPTRIASLQVGNPAELKLLGVLPEEKDLHYDFADLALRGEWFSPGDRLLQFIKRYALNEVPVGWHDIRQAYERRKLKSR